MSQNFKFSPMRASQATPSGNCCIIAVVPSQSCNLPFGIPLSLSHYLLGFTDIVRGTFSRNDKSALPDDILATSASAQADDSAANVRDYKTEKDDGSKTTLRSMKGLARIASATIKLPMDMTLAMTQGLHNAPKLYDDSTVRHMHKVTGAGSGLKAAGKVRKPVNQLSFDTKREAGAGVRCVRRGLRVCNAASTGLEWGRADRHVQRHWERNWRHLAEAVRWSVTASIT
jgi:hypothetical protein